MRITTPYMRLIRAANGQKRRTRGLDRYSNCWISVCSTDQSR